MRGSHPTWKALVLPATIASGCILLVVLYCGMTSSTASKAAGGTLGVPSHARDLANVRLLSKRSSRHSFPRPCHLPDPEPKDVAELCRGYDCSTLPCVYKPPCEAERKTAVKVTCFLRSCNVFSVGDARDGYRDEIRNASLSKISAIVGDRMIKGNTNTDNVARSVHVKCDDRKSFLFGKKLNMEIDIESSGTHCEENLVGTAEPPEFTEIRDSLPAGLNIHVLYFRFISRWESELKLPRLNALMEHMKHNPLWTVNSFRSTQTLDLQLAANLGALLGHSGPGTSKGPSGQRFILIRKAIKAGSCFRFHILTCQHFAVFTEIFNYALLKQNMKNCNLTRSSLVKHQALRQMFNQTYCNNNREHDLEVEDTLHMNENLAAMFSPTTSHVFSLTLFNVLDLPSLYAFDSSVTNVVKHLLASRDAILVLISDVGDPNFSRLDKSTFLKAQTFNPMLHVAQPSHALGVSSPLASHVSSQSSEQFPLRLITLRDLHDALQAQITSMEPGESPSNSSTQQLLGTQNILHNSTTNEPLVIKQCPAPGVKGPVECSCQDRAVKFLNDSVQVAFATVLVGSLNNKLRELFPVEHRMYLKKDAHHRKISLHQAQRQEVVRNARACDSLRGISFTHVQHLLRGNSTTVVLMDLTLISKTRKSSEPIKIRAELEYSVDRASRVPHVTIHLLHPLHSLRPGERLSLDQLGDSSYVSRLHRHLLCRPLDDLSESVASKHSMLQSLSRDGRHFGGKTKVKSLHYPCLYLVTTRFADSSMLEVANVCIDRHYNVSFGAELFDVISLSQLPVDMHVGTREIRYVSSLVKSIYGISQFAYKIHTFYTVLDQQ